MRETIFLFKRHFREGFSTSQRLKNGIKTEIHYPVPPHRQEALTGIWDREECPLSEEIHRTTLSLPISFGHTEDDIRRVIEVMNRF